MDILVSVGGQTNALRQDSIQAHLCGLLPYLPETQRRYSNVINEPPAGLYRWGLGGYRI